MTIVYKPANLLKKMASRKNIEKLLTKKLTVNQTALNALAATDVVGPKIMDDIALTVIQGYRDKVDTLREGGATKAEAEREVTGDPLLLVQRIQNATVDAITTQIKDQYHGEYYVWLPSTAAVPDRKHILKYGRKFQIGRGEAPGDRYGCKCGMKILVDDTQLVLE